MASRHPRPPYLPFGGPVLPLPVGTFLIGGVGTDWTGGCSGAVMLLEPGVLPSEDGAVSRVGYLRIGSVLGTQWGHVFRLV